MARTRRVTALFVAALILSGCGDGRSDTTAATTVSETTTASPATTNPATTATTSTTSATTTSSSTTVAGTTSTTSESPATTTSTTVAGPETVAIDVAVADGEVAGPGRVSVPRGSQIRLTVTSDEADEVHFHGYDIYADVGPGAPAVMILIAEIPGVFEVELEGRGLELVIVEVT